MRISEMIDRLQKLQEEFGNRELEFYFTQPDCLAGPFRDGKFLYGEEANESIIFVASIRGTSDGEEMKGE